MQAWLLARCALAGLLLFVGPTSALEPVDAQLIPEARRVLDWLEAGYGRRVHSGSTSGVAPFLREATGHQPAIQGFDLSGWNSPTWGKTYTPVVERTIEAAKAWWAQGGLVTMQFHWKNPTRPDGSAWAGLPPRGRGTGPLDVAAAITPGTPVNQALMADLAKHADYLERLARAKVPVLWRPYHEIDGGWFWWTDKARPENTAALWRLTYDYLVTERGLHNLIWVYSAGVHAGGLRTALGLTGAARRDPTQEEEVAFRRRYYPGARYVDLAGIDIYPSGEYGPPTDDVYPKAFALMAQVAPGKTLAMCESGVPLNPDLMAKSGPKWLYNLQWFEGEVEWDRKVLGHELITTFAELPPLTPFHAPPSVRLTAPGDGAHSDGEAVELRAEATAREGALAKVEYYRLAAAWQNWFLTKDEERQQALAGATLLAATTPPFAATWRQAPAGLHNVIAKATDAQGAVAWSNVARVAIGAVNLAAGRPTTASTRPEAAAKAVDGSLFTAWNGPKPGSKAKPTDPVVPAEQWLAVDLGAEQTVGCLVVSWWKAYARSYRLEVSPDGQAWREVARQDNKRTFEGNSDVHRFPPVKARHVRLLCLAPGTDWGGYTVYELGVYTALAGG